MKSLLMMVAGAALIAGVVGTTGCVVDWQSQGSIVVHRQAPACEPAATPAYDPYPAPPPVYYAPPPVYVRPCPPPVVYMPAPRPCPAPVIVRTSQPPVVSRGRGWDITVRNYRK